MILFLSQKIIFTTLSAGKRNRKKAASKNIAHIFDSTRDNKRISENINNFFAEKVANTDCVKKVCRTVYCVQSKNTLKTNRFV